MCQNEIEIKNGKINFICKQSNCQHSCCGPFTGISSELKSVDNRPFSEIVLTDEDYALVCENGYEHLTEVGFSEFNKKTYHKMSLKDDGTCKALVDGKCSIYKVSPTLCKAFPFYFDMFSGLCAISCEGFSDENSVDLEEVKPFLKNAEKMYRFWLDFYSK